MYRMVVIMLTLGISACASRPKVDADWTTYPRDKVREVIQAVSLIPIASLPSAIGSIEYQRTIAGDEAEVWGYIVPRTPLEFSEKRLLGRVGENGSRECKGDYRVVETHYFYGTEATLKFKRIQTPALRVKYRCALKLAIPKDNHGAKELERLSRKVQDSNFFDISSKRYPIPKSRLFDAVRRVAVEEGMPIIKEGEVRTGEFLIAGRDPNEIRWGRIEKLAALVGEDSDNAILTFRLFAYQLTYHKRGVMETEGPTDARGAQPWDRKTAYARAMLFLDAIDAAVATARN